MKSEILSNAVPNGYCYSCDKKVQGRSDKKFCNNFCRNNYYNKMVSSSTKYIREINTILRKNRNALQRLLNQKKKVTISRDQLLSAGFRLSHITGIEIVKATTIYYCYELSYTFVSEQKVLIEQKLN